MDHYGLTGGCVTMGLPRLELPLLTHDHMSMSSGWLLGRPIPFSTSAACVRTLGGPTSRIMHPRRYPVRAIDYFSPVDEPAYCQPCCLLGAYTETVTRSLLDNTHVFG